jgi:prolycopene isomerase
MASLGKSRSDEYDVVVVGAGFGGLSAGASLARAGKRVLLVERGEAPGGYGHAFRRGPYTFDPAVHWTAQANDGELLDHYLQLLGVRQRVRFTAVHPAYAVVVAGERFEAPIGVEQFISAHARRFPAEAEEIGRFVNLALKIVRESQQLTQRLSLADLDRASKQFPTLFRYRTALQQEVLDEHFRDPRLKALLSAIWPYFGVPPSAVSFMQFASMLINIMATGTSYSLGGFQVLADAFVAALEQHGGELLLNTQVTGIHLDDGRVAGVGLQDGSTVRAKAVVSNADARQTFEQLVGLEHLPDRFVSRLLRMKPSLSAFVVYAATTLDLGASGLAAETFLWKTWDPEESYRDVLAGRPGGMWISIPTLHDPSLAPPGEHTVIFSSLMPYDIGVPWDEAKKGYTDRLLAELESVLPGFGASVTFLEVATPLTFERYTLNQRGAIYGWDSIPSQSTPRRLPQVTPVPGLYLAGHWTDPGSGSFRSMYSGLFAAALALGYQTPQSLLETFAGAPR